MPEVFHLRAVLTLEQFFVYAGGVGLAVLAKALTAMALRAARPSSMLTPLCPGLIKQHSLKFKMKIEGGSNKFDVVEAGESNKVMCSVDIADRDPDHRIAAIVKLHKQQRTLATVIFRDGAIQGQGIAICREGCEIFGFFEPESRNEYRVRHRTGIGVLTVKGNMNVQDAVIVNANMSPICFAKRLDNLWECQLSPGADPGLVILSLVAAHVYRKIQNEVVDSGPQRMPSDPLSAALLSTEHPKSDSAALGILNQDFKRSAMLKWLPPVYLVVYLSCGVAILLPFLQGAIQILAAGSIVLAALSLVRAAFTDPGEVPDDPFWQLENENIERAQFLRERKRTGGLRTCKWCNIYKPDRAHYCRRSGRCVLQMDLHSPFINNTIGFRNDRFFFQAMFWAVATYLLVLSSMPTFYQQVCDSKTSILSRTCIFAASLGAVVDGMVIGVWFGFRTLLLYKNMTHIEFCEKRKKPGFEDAHQGFLHKFRTWGTNPIKWLLPVDPPPAEEGLRTSKV